MKRMIVKCPICKKDVEWKSNIYRPFCSRRCYLVDLGKWSDEVYSFESEQNSKQPISNKEEINEE